eukprot:3668621-Pleurochrysis_carterae.AAC.1
MRRRNERPPWSVDSTCIIPAVTAAVKNTTFVMMETIGQTLLESRASCFCGTRARSFSSVMFVLAGVSDVRSLGGTRGATFSVGSLDD